MKTRLGVLVLAAAITGITTIGISELPPPATTRPAEPAATEIPVKTVVLYSSGVGYFEHHGVIRGDKSTELRFKTAQINDILKSLLLQDVDGGKVTAVTYASQDPVDKTLKSFAVDITANPPLADLINQLRGAEVTVTSNGDRTVGVILGVEHKKVAIGDKARGDTVDQAVLNLVAGGKIVSQPMDALNSIELDDPKLQGELNKALVAVAGARDQDKKPVKITFTGKGDRHVRLGYVVETPIWKTSYRLILSGNPPEAGAVPATQPAAQGALQGWAIIENQTENDWNNVQLSLVSGRPISFIEDLYMPLYIPRPVVEPELFASLRPQTYAAGGEATTQPSTPPEPGNGQSLFSNSQPGNAPASGGLLNQLRGRREQSQDQQNAGGRGGGAGGGGVGGQGYIRSIDPSASVGSLASAASIGELFEYTVGDVTLPRQRSAMIPIITDPVEVERVSIYNQKVLPRNPLNGVRVKNTTKKHLLGGPVTVLEGSTYAGDAQIDNIPPGQERLLSYGVDLQMLVDTGETSNEQHLLSGRIVKGFLYVKEKSLQSQTYMAENKSDHEKTLLIEHPRDDGWELFDTPAPAEKTDAIYRFRLTIPAGKSARLTVRQQMTDETSVQILPGDGPTLLNYQQSSDIPKKVQNALAKAAEMKTAVVDTDREITADRQTLADISAEQNRIRSNLNTIQKTGQYYTRLMTKLDDQETQIEKTRAAVDDLQKKRSSQQEDLETYVGNLSVE